MAQSQTKGENDYINEDWPTLAKILDINRCAFQFKFIKSLMRLLEIFTTTINNGHAPSLQSRIRISTIYRYQIQCIKYDQDEFVKVNEIFQKRIYPKPYWGKKFTNYEIKIYESVTINPEMDRILDEMKEREKEREKDYNMDIVHLLVILGYGTKSQIMDAIDEVTNKNDINEIIEYLEKQKH